jgi:hypothetical protein
MPRKTNSKKQTEIVGYFLQSNRAFIRDEFGRMNNMYDKYIKGKAIAKKINTYDGMSGDAFFIDFTEFKPKAKKLTAHKTMQGILKKAADAGVISKGMASSFKLGKITVPIIKGKLDLSGLEYEKLKVKPAKKSRKKKLSILGITKEVYTFLTNKGYVLPSKKFTMKDQRFLLIDGKTKVSFESFKGTYTIRFEKKVGKNKYYEMFIKPQMVFDDVDKKVIIQMINRMGVKPAKKSSVSTKTYKSKGTKTKAITIGFRGKKFSITGTLTGFTRAAFVKMVEKLGGKFQNHVSKDLDMLIVGAKPGKTKVAQAKKYGVEIVKFNNIMLMHDSK